MRNIMLIILTILLLAGCDQGVENKAQVEETASLTGQSMKDVILAQKGEKPANASISELDEIMEQLGWEKCPSGLPEKTGVMDSKQNLVKNITVTRKAFQKDDNLFVGLTVESSIAREGDTIQIFYDDNEVYATERYHSEGLDVHTGIGCVNSMVVDSSSSEYWYIFMFKKRDQDNSITIPVTINMELTGKNYFWDTIIRIDER